MLLLKKHQNYFELPLKHFVTGINKVKSVLLELQPEQEDTVSRIFKTILVATALLLTTGKRKYVTVEYLPPSKWMTLNDKKIFSEPTSLITSWFQTLALDLTGKEMGLKPFWTEQCKEISQKLWLPTETDSVDSPLNSLNGFSKEMESNSWFSISKKVNPQTLSSPKTSFPSFMFTPVKKWEEEGMRTRKIRLYPTIAQKKKMKEWMGTRRFVYNKALDAVKKEKHEINFYALRNKLVTAKNNDTIQPWELETPKDIRAGAIRDMVKNYKTAFSQLKNRQISGFSMGYSSKRNTPSIEIPKSALKLGDDGSLFLYKNYISEEIRFRKGKKMNLVIDYDCRLQFKNNVWYLVVPMKTRVESSGERYSYCALDPGVRNFQTVYSEEMVLQFKVKKELVTKLQKKIDTFRSLRSKKLVSRSHFSRREKKIYSRMDNLIDDLHYKTCSYLTSTFNHIILPSFESQEMAKRGSVRGINRNLLQLKHYLFQQRLRAKCEMRRCTLAICTEEYTSQTCGVCGVRTKVGGCDVFRCSSCGLVIDRDYNGARNIAIKVLKEMA